MTSGPPTVAVVAALAVLTLGGCGDEASPDTDGRSEASTAPTTSAGVDATDGDDPNATATADGLRVDTTFGRLQVPASGDDAVAALASMPETVGSWSAKPADRGQAIYDHPGGDLGIEVAELTDVYASAVTPAEAIKLFGKDFDGGSGRSCSSPPGWCATGDLDGQPAMAWTHAQSDVLVVATWPDGPARDALLGAYRTIGATTGH